jgi:hypothetical protein
MVGGATILSDLAHGLPMLDIGAEYTRLVFIERQSEYRAAYDEHADERETILTIARTG